MKDKKMIILLAAALFTSAAVWGQKEQNVSSPKILTGNANPILDFHYWADPGAVEYNDRLYVYGTNDQQQVDSLGTVSNNNYEKIRTLTIASTDDMVNWTYHGEIPAGDISPWALNVWAPTLAKRTEADGKTHFYLYYSNSGNGVGMLTSTSPIGPWSDPLGRNIVDRETSGIGEIEAPFDPGVVVDEQGDGWLTFGGGSPTKTHGTLFQPGNARIVRLDTTMCGLGSRIVPIPAPYHFEANEIDYIGGTWVYSYNTCWYPRDVWTYDGKDKPTICCMSYMTSHTPLLTDSWLYGDNFLKNPMDYGQSAGNNHTHLHKFRGQYYIIYHNTLLGEHRDVKAAGYRSICIDRLVVDETKPSIEMATMTKEGVSQLQPLNPFLLQQAETTATTNGIRFRPSGILGNMWADCKTKGQTIMVRGADFGTDGAKFIAINAQGKGRLEVRLDNPTGRLLATVNINSSDFTTVTQQLKTVATGMHDLCFVVSGGSFLFDNWQFSN